MNVYLAQPRLRQDAARVALQSDGSAKSIWAYGRGAEMMTDLAGELEGGACASFASRQTGCRM